VGDDGQRKPVPPNAGPYFKKLYVDDERSLMNIKNEHEGLSYRRLRQYLQDEGVEFRERPRRKQRLPATAEMILDHSRIGLMKTARKYRINPPILRERLELAGVEIRKRGRPADPDKPPRPKPKRKRKRERRPRPSHHTDPWRQPQREATSLTAGIVEKFVADVPVEQIAEWAGLSEQAVTTRLAREGYEPDA
jgi:hypothetical protein